MHEGGEQENSKNQEQEYIILLMLLQIINFSKQLVKLLYCLIGI